MTAKRFLPPNEAALFNAAGAVEDHGAAAAAIARSTAEREVLIAGSLDAATVARRLGVTTRRVRERLCVDRTLYGFKVGRVWCIPRFQFTGARARRLVPDIELVFPLIPEGASPLAVERFFTLPQCDLEDVNGDPLSPVAWLAARHPAEAVMKLAFEL